MPSTHDVPRPAEPAAAAASLQRSRARRVAVWARSRQAHVRRTRAVAVVAGLAAVAGAASAEERTGGERASDAPRAVAVAAVPMLERGDRGRAVRALQRALGIRADGVFGPRTARAVRRAQRRAGLLVDGIVGPATRAALGLTASATTAPAAGAPATAADGLLARIARCESGGDPTAVSADGRYRGKYQFSRATWRALGGTGDPARAPESEQDRRAAALLAAEGTSPWPSCA